MSFSARETSRSLGAPIALFLFTYGPDAGDVYAYTSSEDMVSYDGNDYVPVPIHNANITVSGTLDKAAMELRLSKALDVTSLFTVWPPSSVVTLRIFEGHVGESEFKARWSGRILSHKIEGDECVFTCEPTSTALRRSGLRRNYQYGCPHVLYGAQCKASQVAATVNVTVQSVTSPFVVLPNGWASSGLQPKYLNGMVAWTNAAGHIERRSIILITSSTEIQLGGDCSTLTPGMSLAVTLGCDHQMDDCKNVHDNINNFGGQPWIPLKNPIGVVDNFN